MDTPVTTEQDQSTASTATITAPPGGKLLHTPSGFTIAWRNPNILRVKDRNSLMSGMESTTDEQGNPVLKDAGTFGMQMLAKIVTMMVAAWDVRHVGEDGLPEGPVLPVSVASYEDMLTTDAKVLESAAEDVQKVINPSFDPDLDEASPTPPSAA